MPALDDIPDLAGTDRVDFDRALGRAADIADRMPLVRVIIPPSRRNQELYDVFRYGRILRNHKGNKAIAIEHRLGSPDVAYFHAGRAHEDYGDAVIVLTDVASQVEVTPFGLGNLCCSGADDERHDNGGCISPLAHHDDGDQRAFVTSSTWTNDWRSRLAEFIAYYYGDEPFRYFGDATESRPRRSDPEGYYSDLRNKDWRVWTAEVRSLEDIDLTAQIVGNRLLLWGVHETIESQIKLDTIRRHARLKELYPIWSSLPRDNRRDVEPLAGGPRFSEVQSAINSIVL